MKTLLTCVLLFVAVTLRSQTFKEYLPSMICTFLGGASDGTRDASLFYRLQGKGQWVDGSVSFKNKYKNGNIAEGSAYLGSTSIFAAATDLPHAANWATHNFNGFAIALAPYDPNKKFGHVVLKVLAYNAIRQMGHTLMYEGIFHK